MKKLPVILFLMMTLSFFTEGALGNVADLESGKPFIAKEYPGTASKVRVVAFDPEKFHPKGIVIPFSGDSHGSWTSIVLNLGEQVITQPPADSHRREMVNLRYPRNIYNFYSLTPSWSD